MLSLENELYSVFEWSSVFGRRDYYLIIDVLCMVCLNRIADTERYQSQHKEIIWNSLFFYLVSDFYIFFSLLAALAFLLCKLIQSREKAEARAATTAISIYHCLLAAAVMIGTVRMNGWSGCVQPDFYFAFTLRSIFAVVSALFNRWIGSNTSGRKLSSLKEPSARTDSTLRKSSNDFPK